MLRWRSSLATPDDRTENGEVKTRGNVVDEHRLAQQKEHLKEKFLGRALGRDPKELGLSRHVVWVTAAIDWSTSLVAGAA